MANSPIADAAAMRPLFIGITLIFVGLFAFAGWVVFDAATHQKTTTLALNTAMCPPPQPGEVLVVTIPAPDAQGDVIPTCTTLQSQGAARARLAAKAAP